MIEAKEGGGGYGRLQEGSIRAPVVRASVPGFVGRSGVAKLVDSECGSVLNFCGETRVKSASVLSYPNGFTHAQNEAVEP